MPTRTKIVTFDNFSGGEFGELGQSAAPQRSFTAKNMLRYQSGLIGPRPGLIRLSPSGIPTGAVWGFRGLGSSVANGIVFGIGTTVYGFTYSPLGAVTVLGTVATTPTLAQIVQHGKKGYLTVQTDKAYRIDPAALTVTALPSSPGGYTICVYGDRLMLANNGSDKARVYFSAAADFLSWPALNYFDVSSNDWDIVALDESRNRLAIGNIGQEWWTLSGVPGVNDTLKRTPRGDLAPQAWYNFARLSESLWFIPYGDDFPVQFTGAVTDKLRFQHLRMTDGAAAPQIAAASLPGSDTVCFVDGSGTNRMMVQHNGTWTYHTLGINAHPLVTPVSHGAVNFRQNPLLLCDGGAVGTAPKFYVWEPTLERPGKVGDTLAQPGDDSQVPLDCYLYTTEWWAQDASEAVVRSVSIDFAKWNTGAVDSNHFELNVRALHRYNSAGYRDSTTHFFDEEASETDADETLDRRVFRMGDQGTGHGFQIRLEAIRGVAFRRITVEVDLDPQR